MKLKMIKVFISLVGLLMLAISVELTITQYLPLLQHIKTVMQFFIPSIALIVGYVVSIFVIVFPFLKSK